MYQIQKSSNEQVITTDDGSILVPYNQSMTTFDVNAIVSGWFFLYRLIFDCCADSDGGIEAHEEKKRKCFLLNPDMIVIDEENVDRAIGVFYNNHVFRFDDPKTQITNSVHHCGYVGTWGNVNETEVFELKKGVPPQESEKLE